jgi:hypothetical protein
VIYRGFKIEPDAESSHPNHFVVYESVQGEWQPIAYANAELVALSLIDHMVLARETLLAPFAPRESGASTG